MSGANQAPAAPPEARPPLPLAGLQLRIVAFILDAMVLAACFMLFAAVAVFQLLLLSDFGEAEEIPDPAFYAAVGIVLSYLLFAPLYFIVLWAWRGQTVGMMAVHIRVEAREGGRLSPGRAAVRLLGYLASILSLGAGVAMALFDPQRRALHDRMADSVVVELP